MSDQTDKRMFECVPYASKISTGQCARNRENPDMRKCNGCGIPAQIASGEVPTCTMEDYRAGNHPAWNVQAPPPPPVRQEPRPAAGQRKPQRQQIRDLLAQHPEGLTAAQIAERTTIPHLSVHPQLSQLRDNGEVAGRGPRPMLWTLVNRPTLPPQPESTFPAMGPKPEGVGQLMVQRRNYAEAISDGPNGRQIDLGRAVEIAEAGRADAYMVMKLWDALPPFDRNWPDHVKARYARIMQFAAEESRR